MHVQEKGSCTKIKGGGDHDITNRRKNLVKYRCLCRSIRYYLCAWLLRSNVADVSRLNKEPNLGVRTSITTLLKLLSPTVHTASICCYVVFAFDNDNSNVLHYHWTSQVFHEIPQVLPACQMSGCNFKA